MNRTQAALVILFSFFITKVNVLRASENTGPKIYSLDQRTFERISQEQTLMNIVECMKLLDTKVDLSAGKIEQLEQNIKRLEKPVLYEEDTGKSRTNTNDQSEKLLLKFFSLQEFVHQNSANILGYIERLQTQIGQSTKNIELLKQQALYQENICKSHVDTNNQLEEYLQRRLNEDSANISERIQPIKIRVNLFTEKIEQLEEQVLHQEEICKTRTNTNNQLENLLQESFKEKKENKGLKKQIDQWGKDNSLLQEIVSRLTGDVKRLFKENETLTARIKEMETKIPGRCKVEKERIKKSINKKSKKRKKSSKERDNNPSKKRRTFEKKM